MFQSGSMLLTIFALVFTFTKEPDVKMIIKSYVTLAFIGKIDDAMANTLPESVWAIAEDMNERKPLKIGQDHHSFKKIFESLKDIKDKKASNVI